MKVVERRTERNPPTFSKSFFDAFQEKNIFFQATLSREKKTITRLTQKNQVSAKPLFFL